MSLFPERKSAKSRRYARACHRVMTGVLGRDITKFFRCVLTTKAGCRNTWPEMCKDLKALCSRLRYRGVVLEYCFCPHVTKSGLLHLDGIVFIPVGSVTLFELQVLWAEIRGASQVDFKPVKSAERVKKYMVGHMVKDAERVTDYKGRMLISKGWLPKDWNIVNKALTAMAINKAPKLGDSVWSLKNSAYERWLNYEVVTIRVFGALIRVKRIMEVY